MRICIKAANVPPLRPFCYRSSKGAALYLQPKPTTTPTRWWSVSNYGEGQTLWYTDLRRRQTMHTWTMSAPNRDHLVGNLNTTSPWTTNKPSWKPLWRSDRDSAFRSWTRKGNFVAKPVDLFSLSWGHGNPFREDQGQAARSGVVFMCHLLKISFLTGPCPNLTISDHVHSSQEWKWEERVILHWKQ